MSESFQQKSLRAIRTLLEGDIRFILSGLDVTIKGTPRKKIFNWVMNGLSAHLRLSRAFGYPSQIQIEPTSRCNLSCIGCPCADTIERKDINLSFDIYKNLIDELSEKLIAVTLFDWGEPFLNTRIYDMIEYASRNEIITATNSNAHVFSNPKNAERLVLSGLDLITFSIDGTTQETYQKFRINGDLKTALKGIRNVVHFKELHNLDTPLINFGFIIMRHNINEIPHLNKFVEDLGCDCLSLKTLNTYSGGVENRNLEELVPLENSYSRFLTTGTERPIRRKRPSCLAPWSNPTVHCNGNLCICFNDYDDNTAVGNLIDIDFKTLWNSKLFKNYRKTFSRNYMELERCRNCTQSFEGGDCAQEVQRDFYAFSKMESRRIKINIKGHGK